MASCMLHKSTILQEQLQQNMFYAATELDNCLTIDRIHCNLHVALLQTDVDGVQLALGKLCEENSPEALWQAASVLRDGVLCCL